MPVMDWLNHAIQDLSFLWFEGYYVKFDRKNDISCGILDHAHQIILSVNVIFVDVDDITEFFCALAHK